MPQVQTTFSYADLVTFVLLIVAFVSIFVVMHRQTRHSRVTLFKELYLMVFGDADFSDAFFLIEKGQFVYGATVASTPHERLVNRLLRFMDLVCEVYADKLLTEQEMSLFKRQFIRVYEHPSIKGYLTFLTEDYTAAGAGTTPFPHFVAYCQKALPSRAAPAAAAGI
jgi:hypothetical protein